MEDRHRMRPGRTGTHAERLRPDTLGDDDIAAWRALADRAVEPNPYNRPEFVLANIQERRLEGVELFVVRDSKAWHACLPVRRRPPTRKLPLPYYEALTDEYTLYGAPLIDREDVEAATHGLLRIVQAQRGASALLLGTIGSDGPAWVALEAEAVRQGIEPTVIQTFERAAWHRPSPGEPEGVILKSSDRRILAKRTRQLQADLGGEVRLVDHPDDPAAWDAFLAIEASGWKAEVGTALQSREQDAAFFRRMCAGMAAAGRLEVVSLVVGDQTVAMECHLVDGDRLYSFKIAYDHDLRRYSPGTQLSAIVIDRFHAQGLILADSCASAGNEHMNRIWPSRRPMLTVLVPTQGSTARLLRPALRAKAVAQRLRDRIRRQDAVDAARDDD